MWFLVGNTLNSTGTAVQNGRRSLTPNRYAAPTFYRAGMGTVVEENWGRKVENGASCTMQRS